MFCYFSVNLEATGIVFLISMFVWRYGNSQSEQATRSKREKQAIERYEKRAMFLQSQYCSVYIQLAGFNQMESEKLGNRRI